MIRSTRFNNAVSALVAGYQNDTLEFGMCRKCAVGHIVAQSMSLNVSSEWRAQWYKHLTSVRDYEDWFFSSEGLQQIESTGYTSHEIDMIEQTFEYSRIEGSGHIFDAMMNVVDTLISLEEGIEEIDPEEVKLMFVS